MQIAPSDESLLKAACSVSPALNDGYSCSFYALERWTP